jgi:hypothetical protein
MTRNITPIDLEVDWTSLPNFIPIIYPLVESYCTAFGYLRKLDIIKKRYGFDGNGVYTLQDLGSYYGIHRERIRQLQDSVEKKIKETLLGKEPRVNIPIELISEILDFKTKLRQLGPIFTEDDLFEVIQQKYQYKPTENDFVAIQFLLKLLDFSIILNTQLGSNIPMTRIWISDSGFDVAKFINVRKRVNDILLKSVKPLSFFEIIVLVNKGRKNVTQQSTVQLAINTINHLEIPDENSYQAGFNLLGSLADKAYRVLYEEQKPLKIGELHREINHRLALGQSNGDVPIRSISQQLTNDKRFKPIGRSGWALAEWDNISTTTISDAIQEFLYVKNGEATVTEISEYVIKKRPNASIKTINSLLSQRDKFIKASENTYILSEWQKKPSYQHKKVNSRKQSTIRESVHQAVREYCELNNFESVKLSQLKLYVQKKVGCKGQTFYRYLGEMGDVQKEKREDGVHCRLLVKPVGVMKPNNEGDWSEIISQGESKVVEFKLAAKWNKFTQKVDGNMIQQIVIEVAGFMNSDFEGRIFIGVEDGTNKIVGIEEDIKVTDKGKQDQDGYQLFLSNSISSQIGQDLAANFEIQFQTINGKKVCCIIVQPAHRVVYVDNHLYLRNNNQTNRLNAKDAIQFEKHRTQKLM